MWIDAHHHVWDPDHRPQPWMDSEWSINRRFTIDDLTEAVSTTPVSSSIVVQTTSSTDETRELLELAKDSTLVAGVIGWCDLLADVPAQVDQLRSAPGFEHLVGFRHQAEDEPDDRWLERDDVTKGVRDLGALGYSFDLLVTPRQLPSAIGLAAATTDTTRLVLDHFGKPPIGRDGLSGWRASVQQLARFDHVATKFSGLVTQADWETWTTNDLSPIFDIALESFGANRLMFGSDWPVCLLAASYSDVVASTAALTRGLTDPERSAVFRQTARDWYSRGNYGGASC